MGGALWAATVSVPQAEFKKLGDTVMNIDKNMAVLTNSVGTLLNEDLVTKAEVIALVSALKSEVMGEVNMLRVEVERISEVQRTKVAELDNLLREFDVLKERMSSEHPRKDANK
jgi:hypothetical protein